MKPVPEGLPRVTPLVTEEAWVLAQEVLYQNLFSAKKKKKVDAWADKENVLKFSLWDPSGPGFLFCCFLEVEELSFSAELTKPKEELGLRRRGPREETGGPGSQRGQGRADPRTGPDSISTDRAPAGV